MTLGKLVQTVWLQMTSLWCYL